MISLKMHYTFDCKGSFHRCQSAFCCGLQGATTSPQHSLHQQSPLSQHSSLLSQQLHTPSMQDPLYNSMDASRVAYPHPAVPINWPGVPHPRSPPTGFAGSPSAAATTLPDHQGMSSHDSRNKVEWICGNLNV